MVQVSPGVVVKEFDISTVVTSVDTSVGAYAGVFRWGPIGQRVLVSSEAQLVAQFGSPTNFNAEGWFCAASFLAYSSNLYVSRAANTTGSNSSVSAFNALATNGTIADFALNVVKNDDDYVTKNGSFSSNVYFVAKYPGAMGNSLRISIADTAAQYSSNIALTGLGGTFSINVGSNTATLVINAASNTEASNSALAFTDSLAVSDVVLIGNSTVGKQYLKVDSITTGNVSGNATTGAVTVTIGFDSNYTGKVDYSTAGTLSRFWEFYKEAGAAPGQSAYVAAYGNAAAQDELHVVVVDDGGKFSGVPGTVLEVYTNLSRATDAKLENNLTNYYKDVLNSQSKYVWWAQDRASAPSANAESVASSSETSVLDMSFRYGSDGPDESTVSVADVETAYDLYADPDAISDVGLIIAGKALGGTYGEQVANYIIDNICEERRDCVVFISPDFSDVVNNSGGELDDVTNFRNQLPSTSYAFMDSGYKYMYDRYNDVYRYVPLNGDTAGLAALVDATNDAWWSPAGFNRGQIKNLVKLAWSPNKAQRDVLYPAGINPVVTFDGQGTVLYGDKTLLTRTSAFDRINVRRLFIVLEKAISAAAQYSLFEFNDSFTQAQFRNMVNPYLRDIQGRRGITDYLVVCDSTNNTGQVVDTNQFVGDIYIKPNRSISFITLNFVAVGSSVSFTEAVGTVGTLVT